MSMQSIEPITSIISPSFGSAPHPSAERGAEIETSARFSLQSARCIADSPPVIGAPKQTIFLPHIKHPCSAMRRKGLPYIFFYMQLI